MKQIVEPNDQNEASNSEKEGSQAWKNFEEFARKIFAVKPEELENLPSEESQPEEKPK